MFFEDTITCISPTKIIFLFLPFSILALSDISKGETREEKGIYKTENNTESQKEYIKISVEDVDIKTLFLAISQVSGKNIVISPDVDVKITCKIEGEFKDVLKALEKAYNIKAEEKDGLILITKKAKRTKLVHLKFAQTKNVIQSISQIEGVRASSTGNIIILEGDEEKISLAEEIAREIDKIPKQILIEAKIFELGKKAASEIGNMLKIKSGSFEGGFDFGGGGGFFSIKSDLIEYKLSLLEQKGEAKIISSPKVITTEGEKAQILQGVSIPYETSTQFIVETRFIDALLSLEVIPFILEDKIIMEIRVSRNFPTAEFRSFRGVPGISKNEMFSKIVVKNGESAVIGGIIIENESKTQDGVPVLSSIPVVGFLFRNTKKSLEKREIIITLTPYVM
jgi:type II secretory pathway component GspD/PulD (secretin)